VSEACRAAGIGRTTAYEWRDTDPVFAAAWKDAEEDAADKLEREAWRRGVEGTDKPITYQGEITGTYKEYSDRMLEILLKGHRPEKFKDKVDVTSDGEKLPVDDVTRATRLAAILAEIEKRNAAD
jgi:hypothetical protein